MGPIGMPEMIMIFIGMLFIPVALAAFVYFVVKRASKPSAPSQPPPLPPEH